MKLPLVKRSVSETKAEIGTEFLGLLEIETRVPIIQSTLFTILRQSHVWNQLPFSFGIKAYVNCRWYLFLAARNT